MFSHASPTYTQPVSIPLTNHPICLDRSSLREEIGERDNRFYLKIKKKLSLSFMVTFPAKSFFSLLKKRGRDRGWAREIWGGMSAHKTRERGKANKSRSRGCHCWWSADRELTDEKTFISDLRSSAMLLSAVVNPSLIQFPSIVQLFICIHNTHMGLSHVETFDTKASLYKLIVKCVHKYIKKNF